MVRIKERVKPQSARTTATFGDRQWPSFCGGSPGASWRYIRRSTQAGYTLRLGRCRLARKRHALGGASAARGVRHVNLIFKGGRALVRQGFNCNRRDRPSRRNLGRRKRQGLPRLDVSPHLAVEKCSCGPLAARQGNSTSKKRPHTIDSRRSTWPSKTATSNTGAKEEVDQTKLIPNYSGLR